MSGDSFLADPKVLAAWAVVHAEIREHLRDDNQQVRKELSRNLRHLRSHIEVIELDRATTISIQREQLPWRYQSKQKVTSRFRVVSYGGGRWARARPYRSWFSTAVPARATTTWSR